VQVVAGARLALDWQEAVTSAEEPTRVEEDGWVELRFHLPGAREVAVVGSFNDWDAGRGALRRESGDVFARRFRLRPGRHEYHLLVDGEPVAPPGAARYVSDDFGGRNAILEVGRSP
jgi:1,4-alpha-glucan branching enzyme